MISIPTWLFAAMILPLVAMVLAVVGVSVYMAVMIGRMMADDAGEPIDILGLVMAGQERDIDD